MRAHETMPQVPFGPNVTGHTAKHNTAIPAFNVRGKNLGKVPWQSYVQSCPGSLYKNCNFAKTTTVIPGSEHNLYVQ